MSSSSSWVGEQRPVYGISDAEARRLPYLVTGERIRTATDTLTLTTDAGPLDLLVGLEDREGVVHGYDALRPAAVRCRRRGVE